MRRLGLVDVGFLLAENREAPMHVGGLALYTLPKGADETTFLHGLAEQLRTADELVPPLGDHLKTTRLGLAGPVNWERDPNLDLEYHVRHSALPRPGRYRELFTLVSRLHTTLLDRNRPLWEMHLIEGLQNRQFAVYTKCHHAAVDGMRAMHINRAMLSTDPNLRREQSPLSLENWQAYRAALKRDQPDTYRDGELRNVSEALKASFDSSARVYSALRKITDVWVRRDQDLLMPFRKVPRSSINTSIYGARRFVAQSWPFERLHAVGKAFDATFNDTVLAMCGGALRRYLLEHAELPEQSLKAMVPLSVRAEGDLDSSNAIASITADLGTNIADPEQRFQAIQASTRAGKVFFQQLSSTEAQLFTLMMQLPATMLLPLGLADKLPPFNTVISNVPGIRETMYWEGARLDGSYPVSIVMDGVAVNITLLTNNDNVDFGIVACRRSMPQVQRIIDYMEDAIAELEEAAGIGGTSRRRAVRGKAPLAKAKPKLKSTRASAPRKPKAKPKAKAKSKAKAKPKVKAKAKAKPKAKTKAKATAKTRSRARKA